MSTEEFVRAYTARTPRSRQLWEEARGVLPGGVSGNAKFFKPYPIYIEKASGSKVVDVDGNVYIDLLAGAGSAILGHGPEAVRRSLPIPAARVSKPSGSSRKSLKCPRGDRLGSAGANTDGLLGWGRYDTLAVLQTSQLS
jgi:hypothetical protein